MEAHSINMHAYSSKTDYIPTPTLLYLCFYSSFFRWAIHGLFFFIFVFFNAQLVDKISPVSGFEPRRNDLAQAQSSLLQPLLPQSLQKLQLPVSPGRPLHGRYAAPRPTSETQGALSYVLLACSMMKIFF